MSEAPLPPLPSRRRPAMMLLIAGVSFFCFCAIIAFVFLGIFGWRLGQPDFHESWSPEHKQMLSNIDKALLRSHAQVDDEEDDDAEEDDEEDDDDEEEECCDDEEETEEKAEQKPLEVLDRFVRWHLKMADTRRELSKVAREGKVYHSSLELNNDSVEHLACKHGYGSLLRELLKRGGRGDVRNDRGISVLEAALMHYTRLKGDVAMLEALMEHGIPGNSDGSNKVIYAWSRDEKPSIEALEKLLEHIGTPWESDIFYISLTEGTLPTMQRLAEKYDWQKSDTIKWKVIFGATVSMRHDSVDKLRWALDQLQANPNYYESTFSPVKWMFVLLNNLAEIRSELQDSKAKEGMAQVVADALDILTLLLAYGGALPDDFDETQLPADPELRTRMEKIIRAYCPGANIPQVTSEN